jgi:AcrR family transcriptional regulator
MADPSDAAAARKAAIVEAATGIFLRYGFKKTSMDDLARAAGLSRQGLYLYFPTKEALFKAMVAHHVDAVRAAGREALAREGLDVEDRLLGAFEAMHGSAVGSENLDELLATTAELVGPVVCELDEALVADVARTLRAAGVAARWKEAGLSAKDLAEHLSAVSDGIKHKVKTPAEYRDRMRVAVRLVCRGAPR